jgi:hypothetical protein
LELRSDRTLAARWETIAVAGPDVRFNLDEEVIAGHRYGCRVRAVNDAGASAWSRRSLVTA